MPRKNNFHFAAIAWRLVALCSVILWILQMPPDALAAEELPSKEERQIIALGQSALEPSQRESSIEALQKFVEDPALSYKVRRFAIRTLGSLNLPGVQMYLLQISEGKSEIEGELLLRDTAYLSYWKTLVELAESDDESIKTLEEGLWATVGGLTAVGVRYWSASELCRRGLVESMEEIERSLRFILASSDADQKVTLCKKQIEVLQSRPTRIDAFRAVLRTADPEREDEFIKWALEELATSGTEEADIAMIEYILRLQNDLRLDGGEFAYYWPFYHLRERGWADSDFRERGVTPRHWQ